MVIKDKNVVAEQKRLFNMVKNGDNIDQEEKKRKQLIAVNTIFEDIYKAEDIRDCILNIKMLYYYLHYDFVKKKLVELYANTDNVQIKETIRQMHTREIDISDVEEIRLMVQEKKELEKMLTDDSWLDI